MRPLEQRLRAHLAVLERDGLLRTRRPPQGIDLSSNDYLGLATHPRIKERMAAAVCAMGAGSTGSRLLRGERDCFTALEERFAEFKGTERSLYFSSGYLANLAVLTTFPESGDTIYSDEWNHASLIDGVRLSGAERVVFPHLRPGPMFAGAFLVTESVFSMDGDLAPLAQYGVEYNKLGANLIVDEAHSVGLYGERGQGLTGGEDVFVSVNPGGKALGVAGAFVAGPAWAIEYLEQRARPFIFSTAAPPAIAAALDASLDVIASEPERRERVRSLARYLRETLTSAGIAVPPGDSPIVPIIIGENERSVAIAAELQRAGFDVRAIRPPTVPQGTARLRISINVGLSEDHIGPLRGKTVRGLFVTGTDTGVGKTVLSAALMLRHPSACYWKPIQTGPDDDTAEVRRLSRGRVMEDGIRLPDPVSPHLAAKRVGVTIALKKLSGDDFFIVEGAGGVLVPVNETETMAALMVLLGLPVIVAARTTLGTINHTLLTLEALRARSLKIAGVFMIGDANRDNRAAIEHYGKVPVLAEMPHFDPLTPENLQAWAETLPKDLIA